MIGGGWDRRIIGLGDHLVAPKNIPNFVPQCYPCFCRLFIVTVDTAFTEYP